MARINPDLGLRPPVIRPVASPVDTFVRPEQGGQLDQLSAALARVSPDISKFSSILGQRADENADTEGKLAADKIRQDGLTLAEATRKGKIPASRNPYFMAGLREQLGRNMADKFDGDLRAAVGQNSDLLSSTNVEDFDKFASKFREEWTKQNVGEGDQDDHFNTGFQFRADAYLTQSRNGFASGIEDKVKNQADEATFAEVYKHIGDTVGKLPADQIAGDITSLTDDLIQKQGRNGRQVMQTVARAIAQAAMNSPDRGLAILDLMSKVKGPFGSLEASSYGGQLLQQAREHVIEQKHQQNEYDNSENDRKRRDKARDLLGQAVKDIVANPRANLTKYLAQAADIPEAVEGLSSLQSGAAQLGQTISDPETKRDLFSRIYTVDSGPGYVTAPSVVKMMNSGRLSATDADWLINRVQERDRAMLEGDPLKKAAQDPDFLSEVQNIDALFDKPLTGIVSGERGKRIANAESELRYNWYQLQESGEAAKMSRDQRIVWLRNESTRIHDNDPGHISMAKAADPQFGGDKAKPPTTLEEMPKQPLLTVDDLRAYQAGRTTDTIRKYIRSLHLSTETLPLFIRAQMEANIPPKEKPKP